MSTVAHTILAQLGGNKFTAMTGASSFASGPKTLSFRIPTAKRGIRAVRIDLDDNDTYTVRFIKMRGYDVVDVANVKNVYCDMLQQVFTQYTGLYTSL